MGHPREDGGSHVPSWLVVLSRADRALSGFSIGSSPGPVCRAASVAPLYRLARWVGRWYARFERGGWTRLPTIDADGSLMRETGSRRSGTCAGPRGLAAAVLVGRREVFGGELAVAPGAKLVAQALAFAERSEARALDSGDVDEGVLRAVVGRDEAVALGRVEPLYGPGRHGRRLQLARSASGGPVEGMRPTPRSGVSRRLCGPASVGVTRCRTGARRWPASPRR